MQVPLLLLPQADATIAPSIPAATPNLIIQLILIASSLLEP
jgi:hypothetical protein